MHRIFEETKKDPTLIELKKYIKKGHIPASLELLTPFRKIFDHLTVSDEGLLMKDEKIILPKALYDVAIKKAHQGAHPGMSGMKRRLRSHFWFPKMDKEIEKFVNCCEQCQMFTNKRTKQPITPITSPEKPWENVNVDLFGPMPDQKHVLVVLDSASRFPAAKIVPNTSAKPVLKAMNEIYTNFGQPSSHRTDNGPPFNSDEFKQYSDERGIEHVKTFPYHPQANPAETFMKPLGKAMKAAHYDKVDKDNALNQLLSSYRATPHPATGEAPGAIMFRSGYKTEFPQKDLSDESVKAAFNHDQQQKIERGANINASKHRKPSNYAVGDKVLVRNQRSSKFQPLFGPEVYEIVSIGNGGAIVENCVDGSLFRRHFDDLKSAPHDTDLHVTWFPPQDVAPPAPPAPLVQQNNDPPPQLARPRFPPPQPRNIRPRRDVRPPGYLQDYVRYVIDV